MQPVRDRLHLRANLKYPPSEIIDVALEFNATIRKMLGVIKLHREQRDLLANVVVQLSRDPRALLLLRVDQSSTQARERFFGKFALGHVHAGADVAFKRAIGTESWYSDIVYPPVF